MGIESSRSGSVHENFGGVPLHRFCADLQSRGVTGVCHLYGPLISEVHELFLSCFLYMGFVRSSKWWCILSLHPFNFLSAESFVSLFCSLHGFCDLQSSDAYYLYIPLISEVLNFFLPFSSM